MRGALLAAALLLAFVPSAQALYEDLTFTTVVEDPADFAGFADLLGFAFAETGDQELVIRYTIDDTLPAAGPVDQDFFFTAGGTDWSTGISADGSAAGNGNYDVPDVKSCVLDGAVGYCVLDYAALGVAVGDSLTGPYAISYVGTAQDYAPAVGGFVPQGLLGAVGTDYTLTGCTRTDGVCPVAVGAASGPVHGNLTSARLVQTFGNATSGLYVYHFSQAAGTVDLAYNVTGNGTVSIAVVDGANATVFNQTFTAPANGTQHLAAAAGNWTYSLNLTGFTGSITLDLGSPTSAGSTASTSSSSTGAAPSSVAGNETADDGEAQAPGSGLLPVVGILVGAVAVSRRRKGQ